MNSTTVGRRRLIRTVATAVAGVLVVVGIAALVVYVVVPWVRGPDEAPERPSITATVDGRSVEVAAFTYCEAKRPDICDPPGETVQVPVAEGQQLEIAVPDAISSARWLLATFYVDPNAPEAPLQEGPEQSFAPGAKDLVSIPDVDDQGRVLAGVEVRLPTGLTNPETQEVTYISHATWSVATR